MNSEDVLINNCLSLDSIQASYSTCSWSFLIRGKALPHVSQFAERISEVNDCKIVVNFGYTTRVLA